MKRVVNSIDEAVLLVQGRLAAAENKTIADFAWFLTPVTSTRTVMATVTPYVKNQDQLDEICAETNVKASMISKHNIVVTFDPGAVSPPVASTAESLSNWYQLLQEENKTLREGNERLKSEIETLKFELEEEKLYWMDQINIVERKTKAKVDDLEEALQVMENRTEKEDDCNLNVVDTFKVVNSKTFQNVFGLVLKLTGNGSVSAAKSHAIMLLGMLGESYDESLSFDQLLHRLGGLVAVGERSNESKAAKLRPVMTLALKSLKKKMDPEVLAQYHEMVKSLSEE